MLDQRPPTRYNQFLKIATYFEGALILVAYGIGWAVSINPLAHIEFSGMALVWGILGTLPLYALFALSYNLPWQGMRAVRNFLVDKLGPFLSRYRWQEMLYLGFLAGISEEILFRGLLQPWFEQNWGWLGGLAFSNLVFALVHWVTPLYALLAGLTGIYLGVALDFGGERNLVVPILIHAIYDFLAFIAVAQTYRRQQSRSF